MNKIKAFFKLVRWPNLIMIAVMMCLVFYRLMFPLFVSGFSDMTPPEPAFFFLLVSMIFIVAGGYVINDFYDKEIDFVNKPEKVLVGKVFSLKETKFYYWILTITGLICGLISSILITKIKFITLFAMLVLLTCLLYSYSSTYKRKLLIGNIIVSLSVAFSVFLPWLFEMLYLSHNVLILSAAKNIMLVLLDFVLIYTVFAFLSTLIREIVKDLEDYQGDAGLHCRTVPVVWGVKTAKIIVYVIIIVLFALIIYYQYILYMMHAIVTLVFMFIVDIMCVVLFMQVINAKEKTDYHHISTIIKIMMLIGILSMGFIR